MHKELVLDTLLRRKERLLRQQADTAQRLAAIEKELGALHMKRNPAIRRVANATQRRIWACIMEGLSNKAIANRLLMTERNVKYHLGGLLKAAGCKTREELYRCGLKKRLAV